MIWFTLEMLSVILINPHNIRLVSPQKWAGSSARLERSTDNRKVGSSNPPRPTILIFICVWFWIGLVLIFCRLLYFFYNFFDRHNDSVQRRRKMLD